MRVAARAPAPARRDRDAHGQTIARASQAQGSPAPRSSAATTPSQAPATRIRAGVGNSTAAAKMGTPKAAARQPGGEAVAAIAIVTAAIPQAEKKKRDC